MATATVNGTAVTFSNSTAAANLGTSFSEDSDSLITSWNVLTASGGGAKATVFSIDDGANDSHLSINSAFTGYDTDLLYKDTAGTKETSQLGAKFWFDADGTVHYDATGIRADLQHLAQGESTTDTIEYTIRLANGTLSVGTLKVVINGTNDAPVIDATHTAATGAAVEDTKVTATGVVASSDVDHNATAAYSGNADGSYGSFAIDAATGQWTYTLDHDRADALSDGETHTETFAVTVTDDHNATATQNVTINVTGTNDAPVIDATHTAATGAAVEDTKVTATGVVASSDVDHNATAAYSGNADGSFGSFAIDASTGQWTYTLDHDKADALSDGETHTETFAVTVTDDHNATATQNVTINVTGTNDAPVIDATHTAATGAAVEDTKVTATGVVASSDVDHNATAAYSGNADGSFGSFAIDASTGQWTYTLDHDKADALSDGETHTETFAVTVTDDHNATATQNVTINVTGTNDAASIDGGTHAIGSVTEDGTLTAGGKLTVSDVDTGENHFLTPTSSDLAGTYGTFSFTSDGTWSYDLNNSAANVQALNATDHPTDSSTVWSADHSASQTIDVTINGTADSHHVENQVTSFTQSIGATQPAGNNGALSGAFDFVLPTSSTDVNPNTFHGTVDFKVAGDLDATRESATITLEFALSGVTGAGTLTARQDTVDTHAAIDINGLTFNSADNSVHVAWSSTGQVHNIDSIAATVHYDYWTA